MKYQQNGQSEQSRQHQPRSEIEMYNEILKPPGSNEFLKDAKLGRGNYDSDYLWQQIRSYRKGLYAHIAFSTVLERRTVYETKIKLAREGYSHYNEETGDVKNWQPLSDEDIDDDQSTWNAERERGEEIWDELGENRSALSEKQAAALLEKTDIPDEFVPVFWQMSAGRHEMSRSKDAELLRDLLTGIKELRADDKNQTQKLLRGED